MNGASSAVRRQVADQVRAPLRRRLAQLGSGYEAVADDAARIVGDAALSGDLVAVTGDALNRRPSSSVRPGEATPIGRVRIPGVSVAPSLTYGNAEGSGFVLGLVPDSRGAIAAQLYGLPPLTVAGMLAERLGEPEPEMLPTDSGVRPETLDRFTGPQHLPRLFQVDSPDFSHREPEQIALWGSGDSLPALGFGIDTQSARWTEIATLWEGLTPLTGEELAAIHLSFSEFKPTDPTIADHLNRYLQAVRQLAELASGPGDYFYANVDGAILREPMDSAAQYLKTAMKGRDGLADPFWPGRDALVYLDKLIEDPTVIGNMQSDPPRLRDGVPSDFFTSDAARKAAEFARVMQYLMEVTDDHALLMALPSGIDLERKGGLARVNLRERPAQETVAPSAAATTGNRSLSRASRRRA